MAAPQRRWDAGVPEKVEPGKTIQMPSKAEAEAETREFDDNEEADKAKSDAEKADRDDKKNSP